jgi:hypothetical protein
MTKGRKPKYGSKRWIELNGLNALKADIPINLKNSKKTPKLEFVAKNNSDIEIKNSKKEQPSKIRVMATGNGEACTSGYIRTLISLKLQHQVKLHHRQLVKQLNHKLVK